MNRLDCLTTCVGKTPLIRLDLGKRRNGAQIWGKLEFLNPGGSLKDRVCLGMVESMEAENGLRPGDTLVEASCGNTAISLAMITAARRYSLILVMPDTVSADRRRFLASYGAEIVLTPQSHGMKGAVTRAEEIVASRKRTYMINQFDNPVNPEVHRRKTAVEILEALGGKVDVFVAGVGTGGTLTGVGEVLKAHKPSTRVVAVEPAESPILSGGNPGPHRIPGIGAGFIPRVLNTDIIDDVAAVSYEQAAAAAAKLAQEEGIFAGLSSGAAVHAAMQQAEGLARKRVVVTVLCDSGERYLCFGP